MQRIIDKFANCLQSELNLDDEKRDAVAYGAYWLLDILLSYGSIIVAGIIFGVLKPALAVTITSSALRVVSGGAHCGSVRNCVMLSIAISIGFGSLARPIAEILPNQLIPISALLVWGPGLIAVKKFSPADTPNKPIVKEAQRRCLQNLSTIFMVGWMICYMVFLIINLVSYEILIASTLGLLWQLFSITPKGYRFTNNIDKLLTYVFGE